MQTPTKNWNDTNRNRDKEYKKKKKWAYGFIQIANDKLNGLCFLSAITLIGAIISGGDCIAQYSLCFWCDLSFYDRQKYIQHRNSSMKTLEEYDWALIRINGFRQMNLVDKISALKMRIKKKKKNNTSLISANRKIRCKFNSAAAAFFSLSCRSINADYGNLPATMLSVSIKVINRFAIKHKKHLPDDWKVNLWCEKKNGVLCWSQRLYSLHKNFFASNFNGVWAIVNYIISSIITYWNEESLCIKFYICV